MNFLYLIILIIGSKIIHAIEVKCVYNFWPNKKGYECTISALEIFTRNTIIEQITGDHLESQSNDDVSALKIINSTVLFMPIGFDKFFKNINVINIKSIALLELNKNELLQFPKLKKLLAAHNEIKIIQEDLFDGNSELEEISLDSNRIAHIAHNFHKHLMNFNKNFSYIGLTNNECIKIGFFAKHLHLWSNYYRRCPFPNEIYCKINGNNIGKLYSDSNFVNIYKDTLHFYHEDLPEKNNPESVSKLITDTAKFFKIPSILGKTFQNLQVLILSAQIEYLSCETMKEFPNLKILELQGNRFARISLNTFRYNLKLEKIDLSHNLIREIDIEAFNHLKNLRFLSLDNNVCTRSDLDATAFTKDEVKEFLHGTVKKVCDRDYDKIICNVGKSNFRYVGSIYYCEFTRQADERDEDYNELEYFSQLASRFVTNRTISDIEGLITKYNNAKTIHYRAGYYLPDLKLVRVTHSKLQYIDPETFIGMNELRVVDLSHNEMNEIPKGLFKENLKLMFVDFSFNQLKKIEFSSQNFKEFVAIRIFENPVVDDEFFEVADVKLSTVNEVEINCIFSGEIKCFIENIKQITEIYNVSDVNLETSQEMPTDYEKILKLSLLSSVMNYLPTNLGIFFKKLQHFKANKRIKEIFRENFQTLQNLRTLDLNQNQIHFIRDSDVFIDCKELWKIDLSSNGMKSIASDTFINLPKLSELPFSINDCASVYLKKEENIQSARFSEFLYLVELCGAKLEYFFTFVK